MKRGFPRSALLVALIILPSAFAALAASNYRTIHKFKYRGKSGDSPEGGLVMDRTGNLYGTTRGRSTSGTIYELSPDAGTWKFQLLYRFKKAGDGSLPRGSMSLDKAGNLYGTTVAGGFANLGTIFELSPNGNGTWTEKLLHSFDNSDGQGPNGPLVFDSVGNLYGTTYIGGGTD